VQKLLYAINAMIYLLGMCFKILLKEMKCYCCEFYICYAYHFKSRQFA